MTNTELLKALRFLYRLKKLTYKGEELKNGIVAHLEARNLTQLNFLRYRAYLKKGELIIEELPRIDERQLEFGEMQNVFVLRR